MLKLSQCYDYHQENSQCSVNCLDRVHVMQCHQVPSNSWSRNSWFVPWLHHFSSIPNRMKGHNCLNDWIFHCPRESSLRMRPFEISHKIFKIWKLQIRWKSRLENQFSSWLQTSGWSFRCHLSDRISRWKFKNLQKFLSKFRGFGREVI